MFPKRGVEYSLLSVLVLSFIAACTGTDLGTIIGAQPTGNLKDMLSHKLERGARNKLALSRDLAEQSFRQFINSKPQESTLIGEIKPNASELERMLLRTKIASTIKSMQEMDKQKESAPNALSVLSAEPKEAECYIEVTRMEKVPGKCKRLSGGLPICQSDSYMTFSNECS